MSAIITNEDTNLLIDLLKLNTVTPMETGTISQINEAQKIYAKYANDMGFQIVHFEPPARSALAENFIPLTVLEKANEMGTAFFNCQPNLVLQRGNSQKQENTLLFNFHMDTVSGDVTVRHSDNKIYGRGIVDAKGLGVALLAGIRQAEKEDPSIFDNISVIIQSVSGEEGGAMGVYGTRYVTELGWIGKLNIVCEPTRFGIFDYTTTSMTARFDICGQGSTDDAPCDGQNATILLASLADFLTKNVSNKVFNANGKMCIAGIHTGKMHNRVYGEGQLLVNFAYTSAELANQIERWLTEAFEQWKSYFKKTYDKMVVTYATTLAIERICRMTWVKRGLPVLNNRSLVFEKLFDSIGLKRHDENSTIKPFTCDAMWLQKPTCYTVILGPGDLSLNHAHAADEYIDVPDYNLYAKHISQVIKKFRIYARENNCR
jgi:acetylornithine deacetylase